jgi:hypothetical protein
MRVTTAAEQARLLSVVRQEAMRTANEGGNQLTPK